MDTYDDLAVRAERGELNPSGRVRRGEAATQAGREALMEATGAASAEEAVELALGARGVDS